VTEDVHVTVDVVEDAAALGPVALAYLWVRLGDDGLPAAGGSIRPGLPADVFEDLWSWVVMRLRRAAFPDGSEPDLWYRNADGRYEVWALPGSLPPLVTARD
jgi:hypothetical protein